MLHRERVRELLEAQELDRPVRVMGWIRNERGNKFVRFIALNDGSCQANVQVVANVEDFSEELLRRFHAGACLNITGQLVASNGQGQRVEVQAKEIEVLGDANPEEYPIQPKKHSMEFLRENAHLRARTNTFAAVMRLRHGLAFGVHQFFHKKGFYWMHTPIITGADAEGAGEMFQVSTFPHDGSAPKTEEGAIDYSQDFFGKSTNLTVSGQLEAETGAMALGNVYTFGPTFRAENSNTTRHLAEFWMIEPEMAFYELEDNMNLAESFMKAVIRFALENYPEEIKFLDERFAKENNAKPKLERAEQGLLERLNFVLENDFVRLTYTEAIEILLNSKPHKKKKFKYPVEWGIDLQSEHERYLVEKHFKCPVILTDYPKDIKAFYMRLNEDGKTVRAMDVLFPGIGEIIGGSQREERLDVLKQRMTEMDVHEDELWWYLDLRKFGTAKHSGFGLGFERLIQFVTGMGNIRDVIPFPRTPKNAEF